VELAFQHAIGAARFLLGAQLAVIVRIAATAELGAFAMLPGRVAAALKRALGAKTTLAFKKQLFALSPAQSTNWPDT
jgi:hypothetical protein